LANNSKIYEPFKSWQETPPSAQNKGWLKYKPSNIEEWRKTLDSFYNDETFVAKLSPNIKKSFYAAIEQNGNFYAFGGYRGWDLLVISPSSQRMFYLARD
jgi:hypothetical protein